MKNKRNHDKDCKICKFVAKNKLSLSIHIRCAHRMCSQEYYDIYLKRVGDGVCLNCGRPTKWIRANGFYSLYCGRSCSAHHTLDKRKCVCLAHYGVDNPSKAVEIKNKKKKTCNKNYGVDNPAKCKQIMSRIEQTCLKRYGAKHFLQSDIGISKRYDYKTYKLPSGNEIKIQGYEPQFLDFIFQSKLLTENDISYSRRCIKYEINGVEHNYYPDFFVPKLNLLIEPKSRYVLEMQGVDVQKAKEDACKKQGYKYLLVLDNDFSVVEEFFK